MLIALILSNQLRLRLNMHVCVFVERESVAEYWKKRTTCLSMEPCLVPRTASVCAWMGIPETFWDEP